MDPEWAPCGACGCVDGDAGYERWELKGIWKSRVCPRRVVTDESRRWIALFQHYRAGHLMMAGGVFDQPARYMEAMRVIDGAVRSE